MISGEASTSSINIDSGIVLGFGGTNARAAVCREGDIEGFTSLPTPTQPREFFDWMARQVLQAAEAGNSWLVAGFPGPISPDGRLVGPMANVSGMTNSQYDLVEELAAADPAARRLFEDGDFSLVAVNDGELAAQAAASKIGEHRYSRTAALILGTGVGAGIVSRDPEYETVYRADKDNPAEIGHIPLTSDPYDTFENAVSGTAIAKTYGSDPTLLPVDHPAWAKVGDSAARLSSILGLMNGVELVVPCGGVGSGAWNSYSPHLLATLRNYREHGNGAQKQFLPEVIPVPTSDAQVFEMFGAEGVMRDFVTRK
jgi:predicted NBD/HSP70 family sugar kinase